MVWSNERGGRVPSAVHAVRLRFVCSLGDSLDCTLSSWPPRNTLFDVEESLAARIGSARWTCRGLAVKPSGHARSVILMAARALIRAHQLHDLALQRHEADSTTLVALVAVALSMDN
eukprot:7385287-Prymnesium_polylepis.1